MSKLFNNKNELDLELDSVICSSFNRYAKYIIQDRALPDIRDGLKPVQRRILYAMYNLGLFYNKPYKKAARTVGEVIGKYHPHGDSSIYDALVRMSQSWKNNLCLVEMHGNNGSIDGDSAAAMRYTEARLSFYGQTLLDNIEKKIVKFIDNFDDCEKEPSVLPASLPNLLINGATGIAAGYATNIPPFNLNEVCDAVIYVLDNENARTDDLLKIMPGPDFPTAGIVQSKTGIKDFYTTGKGKIVIKAKAQIIDLDNIVQIKIVEIPFDVNKALLVKSIDDIRIENKIPGIIEVRDESDKNGIAICIDIEKHRNINAIQAYLFKNTKLQISYSVNIVVIENRKPVQKGIKEILDSYIKWINKLIIANAKYDLDNLIARQEIVEGMLKALSQIDQLIDLIRSSNSKADAINKIVTYFNLTQKQADAVVSLRLYNLTNFDIAKLNSELSDISLKIIDKKLIIDNKNHRKNIIKNLLNNYKINFGRKRLSKIEDQVDEYEFNQSDVIDVVTRSIVVSQGGYIKYTNDYLPNISSILNLKYKSDDLPIYFNSKLNTLQHLFVITSKARCISIPAFKIKPCLSKYNLGIHINELTTLDIDEKILLAFSANKLLLQEMKLLLASKNNFIKIIETADFAIANTVKVQSCMKLKKDDQLVSCVILEDDASDVVVATTKGNILKYKIDEIPLLKRQAAGVINLKLKNNDSVCCVTTVVDFDSAIIIFANSKLKKIKASDLETSKRGYSGRKCFLINTTDDMVIALSCVKKDNFIIVNDNEKNYLLNHETIDFANFYDKFKKSALLYKIANLNDQASALYNKENNTNDKC